MLNEFLEYSAKLASLLEQEALLNEAEYDYLETDYGNELKDNNPAEFYRQKAALARGDFSFNKPEKDSEEKPKVVQVIDNHPEDEVSQLEMKLNESQELNESFRGALLRKGIEHLNNDQCDKIFKKIYSNKKIGNELAKKASLDKCLKAPLSEKREVLIALFNKSNDKKSLEIIRDGEKKCQEFVKGEGLTEQSLNEFFFVAPDVPATNIALGVITAIAAIAFSVLGALAGIWILFGLAFFEGAFAIFSFYKAKKQLDAKKKTITMQLVPKELVDLDADLNSGKALDKKEESKDDSDKKEEK